MITDECSISIIMHKYQQQHIGLHNTMKFVLATLIICQFLGSHCSADRMFGPPSVLTAVAAVYFMDLTYVFSLQPQEFYETVQLISTLQVRKIIYAMHCDEHAGISEQTGGNILHSIDRHR